MGYRSSWKLSVQARTQSALSDFLTWMDAYRQNNAADIRAVMDFIIQSVIVKQGLIAEFGDDSTKCGLYWDDVIDDIFFHVDDHDDLDCGYARIGEDLDDMEQRYGNHTYVYIHREIDDTDFQDFDPSRDKKDEWVGLQEPKEEKCSNQMCSRMKDVGQPCWWCGH